MNNDLAEWDDKEFAEELRDMFWVEFSQISVTIGQSMAGTSPSSSSMNEESASLPHWSSKEYGQNHPDWRDFLTGLKSGAVYEQVVNDFLSWQHNINDPITDMAY